MEHVAGRASSFSSTRGGMEHIGAATSPVFGQWNEVDTPLVHLRMLYATNAITISITGLSNVSPSMVTIGESIFARSVNRN